MAEDSLLSPGEEDIIGTAKAKRKLKKQQKELAKAKEELKADTIGRKLKMSLLSTPSKKSSKKVSPFKKQKIFGARAEAPEYTKEQNILRGMFGHGGKVMTNFDGRSLPRIHNTLNSGNGILKSGDRNHETAGMFFGGKSLPFFGGQGRKIIGKDIV